MKNNFKNLKTKTQKKGFTPIPSFLLSKRGTLNNKKKKNLVWRFTPPAFTKVGGFTLIETLVGISILLVSVVGPLTIAYQGVSLSLIARDQIVASLLAQEGMEFVRFRIGTNNNLGSVGNHLIATTTAYTTEYNLSDCSGQSCTVNVFTNTTASCGGTCPYLKYNSATGEYNYTAGDDTFFRRSIRIDHAGGPGDVEFQVESKVEWGRPDNVRSIVLKEVIMDWQP